MATDQAAAWIEAGIRWLSTEEGRAGFAAFVGSLMTVITQKILWPCFKEAGLAALNGAKALVRLAVPKADPLMGMLLVALEDNEAIWYSGRGEQSELLAGGLTVKAETLASDRNSVVAVRALRVGDRDVLPDLSPSERTRVSDAVRRAVARTVERERLARRAESLAAVGHVRQE